MQCIKFTTITQSTAVRQCSSSIVGVDYTKAHSVVVVHYQPFKNTELIKDTKHIHCNKSGHIFINIYNDKEV